MDFGSQWRAIQQASSVIGRRCRPTGYGDEASSSAGGTILTHLQQEEENDDMRRVDATPFPSYLSAHQAVAAVAPEYGHIQAAFLPSTHATRASTSSYTMPFITLAEPSLVLDRHLHLQQMVHHDEKPRICSTTAQGVTPPSAVATALLASSVSASSLVVSASPSTTSNSSAHDAVAGNATPAMITLNCHVSRSRDDVGEVETYKAMISAHPSYPRLVLAYANCQKVGAPPEILTHLDEISRKYQNVQQRPSNFTNRTIGGQDPELDEFMDVYCDMLHKYHSELIKPFKEATSFFRNMEHQLNALNKGRNLKLSQAAIDDPHIDAAGGAPGTSDDEDGNYGELDLHVDGKEGQHVVAGGDGRRRNSSNGIMLTQHGMMMHEGGTMIDPLAEEQKIKELLMQHYKGQIGNLKQEFLKKKKKGKLPKEARDKLLSWWTQHYKWPYPSEIEKASLAETTRLDPKQINNWFINQRKRHWKPSEDLQLLMNTSHPPHHHDLQVDQVLAPIATTTTMQSLQVSMQDQHYHAHIHDPMQYCYQDYALNMMCHHQSNTNFNVEHTSSNIESHHQSMF